MPEPSSDRAWTRYFFYRTEHVRTTWTFRLAVLVGVGLSIWLTRSWWMVAVARSLVCEANAAASDAIVVENFDSNYATFERAAQLLRAGVASRALVPVPTDPNSHE